MAKTARRKTTRKTAGRKSGASRTKSTAKRKTGKKRWSQKVTEHSDALDLKGGVFKLRDPKRIAASLKRSAERSTRRKSGAYRSAVSMLTFYINRAGKTLPKPQRDRLQRAKGVSTRGMSEIRDDVGRQRYISTPRGYCP